MRVKRCHNFQGIFHQLCLGLNLTHIFSSISAKTLLEEAELYLPYFWELSLQISDATIFSQS